MPSTRSIEVDVDLPSLNRAKLRSERVRILCMMGVFTLFASLGVFRIGIPIEGQQALGWVIFGISATFVLLEAVMYRVVSWVIQREASWDRRWGVLHAVAECLFPIVTIYALGRMNPSLRYTLLVSPAYAFLMILIAVSVLRVDVRATLLTGAFAMLGYGCLVAFALIGDDAGIVNPHPSAMYVTLTAALGLATLVNAFVAVRVRGYLLAAIRELEVRRQRDRLKRDLEIAGDIQQRLLPQSIPELSGYDFAAVNRPADETGGDYYDWQEISPQRVVFSLGDVTGHGVGPALVTAACRAYVRAAFSNEPIASVVLARVNQLLHDDLSDGRFVTLVVADLDAENHTIRLLSAGHGPTFHVAARDSQVQQLDAQGLPLGPFDDPMLDSAIEIRMEPGDVMVLCSDGFFESMNPAGDLFGLERLEKIFRDHRHRSAAEMLEATEVAVREFTHGLPQPDDMTALVIKRVT